MRQNLGEVERFGVGQLVDLLAATEAVGNHNRSWRRGLNGWEQFLVGNGLRHFEFISFKTKWTGHAAAAGLDQFRRRAGLAQKRDFAAWTAEDRLVMAMALY